MDKKIKQIYENYLKKTKEFYGQLPVYCFETQLNFGENPENSYASGADCISNTIYINPQDNDIEWTIFHEMEHIRTAHNIGKNLMTGLRSINSPFGDSINEALTELSVEHMLGRKQTKVGYYEAIALTKQFGALFGLDERELLKFYSKNGRNELAQFVKEQTGEDCLDKIIQAMDNVQELHSKDLEKEYIENGKILQKPLGKSFSRDTQLARVNYKMIMENIFGKIIRKGEISRDELLKRYEKFVELSPYKNNELEIDEEPEDK